MTTHTFVPDLKTLIKDNVVRFNFYRAGNLYYEVSVSLRYGIETYQFPVPVSDIGDATFLKEDKAILFIRYIRKAIDNKELEKLPTP